MVHILETLQRLETKFDNLSVQGGSSLTTPSSGRERGNQGDRHSYNFGSTLVSPHVDVLADTRGDAFPRELQRSYQHLTVAHKVLLWPAIYLHILNSGISAADDLQYVLQDGTTWFIHHEIEKHPDPLPADQDLRSFVIPSSRPGESRKGFPSLTLDNIQRMTDAYFSTFNVLYPILNRESFMNDVVGSVMRNGYGEDAGTTLALLVFALGQVAIDGVYSPPIASSNGVPSGLRGGSADKPPGLDLFNEARKRVGFIQHQISLENVQILLLSA